jgi:predicted O-methyltransferase YrrM
MARGSIGLDDRLNRYLADNHPPEHPVLAELRKVTAKMPGSEMQVAPEQGHLLAFLARLIGAKNALEIGTFTGYSALAVALALPKGGHLIACDVNEARTSIGRRHWEKGGCRRQDRAPPRTGTRHAQGAEAGGMGEPLRLRLHRRGQERV